MKVTRRQQLAILVAGLLGHCLAAEKSLVVVVNSGDATATIYAATRIGSTGDPTLNSLKSLPTGKGPNEVCLSPDGVRAYVSNRADTSITVIDLNTTAVVMTITDGAIKNPDGCVVSADGSLLYTAAAGGNSVFVFSTADGHKVDEIAVGQEPRRLQFSTDGSRLYVSNGSERFLSIVDVKTRKTVGTVKAGRDPRWMAISPDGQYLAVSNVSDDTVQFVKLGQSDPEFVVGVPKSPQKLAVVPAKQLLFAVSRVDGVLSILDVRPENKEYGRLVSTLPVGHGAWAVALSAAGDCLYVTNTFDNTISLVDLRLMKVTMTLPTGKSPLGLAVR